MISTRTTPGTPPAPPDRWPGRVLIAALAAAVALGAVNVVDSRGHDVDASSSPTGVVVMVDPFRILDTRSGIGTGGDTQPVGPDSTITVQIAGVGSVPADATGIIVNLTATDGTQPSYVTAWPTGTARHDASVLNITPGIDLPNMITTNVTGSAGAPLGLVAGSTPQLADVGMCYQPSGGGTITNMYGSNFSQQYFTSARATYATSATKALPAGTYNVGMCVRNNGSSTISNNNFLNRWILVTN